MLRTINGIDFVLFTCLLFTIARGSEWKKRFETERNFTLKKLAEICELQMKRHEDFKILQDNSYLVRGEKCPRCGIDDSTSRNDTERWFFCGTCGLDYSWDNEPHANCFADQCLAPTAGTVDNDCPVLVNP